MPFRPSAPLLKKRPSASSALWLARQYKDPYVRSRLSNPANYRSRSAFKLLEVEARFGFLKAFLREARESVECGGKGKGTRSLPRRSFNVVDLGAAPGGWSQVIAAKLGLSGEEAELEGAEKPMRKPASNMPEWKEEMRRRKKLGEIYDDTVDEEIEETEHLVGQDTKKDWSTPPSQQSKIFGLQRSTQDSEADFDSMDPLDYLNSHDLNSTSATSTVSSSLPLLPINLVALDILPIRPMPGVHTLQMDFLSPEAAGSLTTLLAKLNTSTVSDRATKALNSTPARIDLLLSDLSPPHTGNRTADVSHSVTLLCAVWDFARNTLKTSLEYHKERVRREQWMSQDVERQRGLSGTGKQPTSKQSVEKPDEDATKGGSPSRGSTNIKSILRNGGIIVLKHFAHPISTSFCRVFLNPYFSKILYFKPPASRSDSSEGYWVCIGWKGVPDHVTMEQLEERMQSDVEKETAKAEEQREEQVKVEGSQWKERLNNKMEKDIKVSMNINGEIEAASPRVRDTEPQSAGRSRLLFPPTFNLSSLIKTHQAQNDAVTTPITVKSDSYVADRVAESTTEMIVDHDPSGVDRESVVDSPLPEHSTVSLCRTSANVVELEETAHPTSMSTFAIPEAERVLDIEAAAGNGAVAIDWRPRPKSTLNRKQNPCEQSEAGTDQHNIEDVKGSKPSVDASK